MLGYVSAGLKLIPGMGPVLAGFALFHKSTIGRLVEAFLLKKTYDVLVANHEEALAKEIDDLTPVDLSATKDL